MNRTIKLSVILLLVLSLMWGCSSNRAVTPETALESYLANNDKSFEWELADSYEQNGLKVYNLMVTSQKWREYTWKHQVAVIVPEKIDYDGALLFITGGSNKNEMPNWKKPDDGTIQMMGMVAQKNNALVVVVFQVPNQPLFDDLTEDEIISLTLHNYRNDKDLTWPLLFPMVKSAVRAMDAVQEFSSQTLKHEINRFVVSGASKRGWTTWLTGASDPRVEAIAPMVIDMLNMPVNIDYHVKAWGDYSIQIADYVRLGIAQDVNTPDGQEITTMIDPYSYRKKLTMPKLIFNGTNDEYWPVDAVKNYLDQIPGENYLHYVPNAGHGLGDKKQAVQALSAFFGETLERKGYPECSWEIKENGREILLHVNASEEELAGVVLWTVDSDDRDFRDNEFIKKDLPKGENSVVEVTLSYPESGFRAFYIDLLYPDKNGDIYSISTRMFVADENEVL
ncbi:PhoPQ-activated pathogenicity-like protein PqaA type [Mariniphaga sediminis]|uniref:PhoPQ-activated pathogenicity-like protein PqaA type n=1 Tax=Mariniphaga sediminis TaxID=1628158 RepID=A0A399CY78_9BACT|nr:PhoPQ-activated protein PqaA family protein [Mariniphaga sediminis]RIH64113.1 PhoPQ-activated pathogenicity-like protein PqaA type [Mariniphaga sediminis]